MTGPRRPTAPAVALAAAFVVFIAVAQLLLHAHDTECFERTVAIEVADPSSNLGGGCTGAPFLAAGRSVAGDRAALAADPSHEIDQPEPTGARSALYLWISLLSAEAGLAVAAAIITVDRLRHRGRWWLHGATTVVLALAVPMLVLRLVAPRGLSDYELLHHAVIQWLVPLLVATGAAAGGGLRMITAELRARPPTGFAGLARPRRDIDTLTALLGALLTLTVVTTGARWQAISMLPGADPLPGSLILLYGGLFTAVAAAVYVPAFQSYADAARTLIQADLQGHGFDNDAIDRRAKLGQELGLSSGPVPLPRSLSVLAPVVSAAVAALLG